MTSCRFLVIILSMKKLKVSVVINIIIFVLMAVGTVFMFTGFKFTHGQGVPLEATKLEMLKFFTVDSNIFAGFVSLVMAVKEINVIKWKSPALSRAMYIWKYIATIAVSLTFLIVFGYFWLVLRIPILAMLQNSNLFFHLVIPVLCIFSFVFLERSNKIRFRHTWIGLVPTFLYAVFYAIVAFTHMEGGITPARYDWYGFTKAGIGPAIAVIPGMLIITYIICVLLWAANRTWRSR